MNHPIDEQELLLHHWGDPALDPLRQREIRAGLAADLERRARLRERVAVL